MTPADLCEGFFYDRVECGLAATDNMTQPPVPPDAVAQVDFQKLVAAHQDMARHLHVVQQELKVLKEAQHSLMQRFLSFSTEGLYQHIESVRNSVADLYHHMSKVREDVSGSQRRQQSFEMATTMRYEYLLNLVRTLGKVVRERFGLSAEGPSAC